MNTTSNNFYFFILLINKSKSFQPVANLLQENKVVVILKTNLSNKQIRLLKQNTKSNTKK